MQTTPFTLIKRKLRLLITVLGLGCAMSLAGQIPVKTASALRAGDWHKVSVETAGIYKIDHSFIDAMGISSAEAYTLQVYGNRGGMLPQRVGDDRTDDIEQIPTFRSGLTDGSFDPGDYILFYAEGSSIKMIDLEGERITQPANIYDERNHYFLGITDEQTLEIDSRGSLAEGDIEITSFDDHQRLEDDRVNLLGKFRPPGSGKLWFGDEFSAVRDKNYNVFFPNIVVGGEVELRMSFAGRSGVTSVVYANVEGTAMSASMSGVKLGDVESPYTRIGYLQGSYLASRDVQEILVSYPDAGSTVTEGWLDYIELQAKRELTLEDVALPFQSFESARHSTATFVIEGIGSSTQIWDITNPMKPVLQDYKANGNSGIFSAATDSTLLQFIAFNSSSVLQAPQYDGPVANQDIHGLSRSDLVIIYHESFQDAAMRLATHRVEHNNYSVSAFSVQQIMNEFAGGSMDPTAIRDFAAMLFKRDADFRYLLFVGDGSYDYKHLNKEKENDNFVPVYETYESMNPIRSFPSDDYYSLLNENEGANLLGAIDIAVGRLPVGTPAEAESSVEKIIHYDVSPTTLGDWRQRVVFVADDEDSNLHLNQSEDICSETESDNPDFNFNRVYCDAFPQLSTPGGPRYPDVNEAINNSLFKGVLAINYLGHGGPQGWAQERILRNGDIQSWSNFDMLPLFVTATCSFTGYDEPGYVSAGEEVFLNPDGGAVALLTTVRPVYSSSNKRLTSEVFEHLFDKVNGEYLGLGDIMRIAKNSNSQDTIDINARKFTIIGDPSMKLAYPKHKMSITELNGKPVGTESDTVGALDKVSLKGQVEDDNGTVLSNFNGTATVTLYDKPIVISTLANDSKSYVREFKNLSRIIFKGTASVTNGEFEISFVIPKDINFDYGIGKISMYASDEISMDAGGTYQNLVVGGSAEDGAEDDKGPLVEAYINSTSFTSGSVVGSNSTLLVKLFDENGINVTGNSIGHDLVAQLDGESSQSFVLNDFYEALENDFTRGEVRFPLSNIPPGRHSITVTAWDVANNFGEATVEFVVEENPDNVIRSLISYPNPGKVGGPTAFRIEHDLQVSAVDVEIEIFDITGRRVASIFEANAPSDAGVIEGIEWDVTNSSSIPSAAGIFFFRALLTSESSSSGQKIYESSFNKLVLFN